MKTIILFTLFFIFTFAQEKDETPKQQTVVDEMIRSMESLHKVYKDMKREIRKKKGSSHNEQIKESNQFNELKELEELKETKINQDHTCNSGTKIYTMKKQSVCDVNNVVRINNFYVLEKEDTEINVNATQLLSTNVTCKQETCYVEEFYINENLYSIDELNYTECVIHDYTPRKNKVMSDIDISILCDDTYLYSREYYGFECFNVNLVCDGKVINNHEYETIDLKQFKSCELVNKDCNMKSECYDLSLNCPAEYQCELTINKHSACNSNCTATRLYASCDCPPDKKGTWCDQQGDVTCDIINVESSVEPFSQSKYLERDDPFEEYALKIYPFDGQTNITFEFNLSCINSIKKEEGFDYWLESDNLTLSSDPKRKLVVNVINFYQIQKQLEQFVASIDETQYVGNETIEITIDAKFLNETNSWNGDLLYCEVSIVPELPSTDSAIYKFYIQRKHVEEKYNQTSWIGENWLTLVIIGVLIVVICLIIVWYQIQNKRVFVHVKQN